MCIRDRGEVVGRHDGLMYYTLGQRRGLNIGGSKDGTGERWFVVEKDMQNNILYVSQGAESELLYSRALVMSGMNFISGGGERKSFECGAKVRYRQPDQKGRAEKLGDALYRVEFEEKQRAVTPGPVSYTHLDVYKRQPSLPEHKEGCDRLWRFECCTYGDRPQKSKVECEKCGVYAAGT